VYLQALVKGEVDVVGAGRVVLMRLSQGAASCLVAGLLGGGGRGGYVWVSTVSEGGGGVC